MNNDNNHGSEALKAGTWYVVSSIVVKGIAFISTPIFTRMMSTAEYGMAATFLSWFSLLYPLCTFNLSFSVGRAKIDYKKDLDGFIGSIQFLSLIISIIITGVLFVFRKSFLVLFGIDEAIYYLLLLYLIVSPVIEFRQNGYRYRYKYKQNIAIAWYLALVSVILSMLLIYFVPENKALLRAVGIVSPSVAISLYFWMDSARRKTIKYNSSYWKYGLLISGPLIFHTLSLNVLSQADRIFISKYCGSVDTGIYSLVYSYGLLITVITNAVADGWLPWFHDAYHEGNFSEIRKNVKWIILFGCFIGLACVAFAPEAIFILGGKNYYTGVYCVLPIVMGVVCQFIYTHYVNIELHLKKTQYVAIGTVGAAIINVALNSIFVPKFGFIAAAYTTLVSYIALLILHYFITRFVIKVRLYNDTFIFACIAVTAMICLLIGLIYKNSRIRYALICIGFAVFIILFKDIGLTYIYSRKANRR